MKEKRRILTVPNILSGVRVLLIAPFVACYLTNHTVWAWVALGVSGVTDFLDGRLARHLGQVTELGKILDPAADKLTQGAVAVCLAVKQPLLLPLLGLFLLKEFLMLVGGIVLVANRKRPRAAKWYGKVATASFYASFVTLVALKGIWHYESVEVSYILLSITAGFMIYAFIRYLGLFGELVRSTDPADCFEWKHKERTSGSQPVLERVKEQAELGKEP